MNSWSEGSEEQGPSVEAMVLEEQSLTLEERRARYKCGGRFVTEDKLVAWDETWAGLDPRLLEVAPLYAFDAELNSKVCLMRGDITHLEVDAVVNAANERLLGGGGIDGAIHSAAGRQLYLECKPLGGTPTGTTKITRGYNLPAKYVLHTVGPAGQGEALLASCYRTLLQIVQQKDDIQTIALCGVSTGIFGFDLEKASRIALTEVREWMQANRDRVDKIVFCTFLEKELDMYRKLFPAFFPVK